MTLLVRLLLVVIILVGCVYYFISDEISKEGEPQPSSISQSNKRQIREPMAQTKEISQRKLDDGEVKKQITSLWAAADYEAVTRVYGAWIFESPEAAIDFVGGLIFPMPPAHFAPDIKIYFDSLSPEEAMLLTLKLANDQSVQQSVSAESFVRWLAEDPETPVDWLFENKDQAFTASLAERMGRLGHFGNPPQALEEVLQREGGALQRSLIKGVLINWLYQNEGAAVEHLNDASSSSTYDEAITAYTGEKISVNPVTAMAWAHTIKNERLKLMVLSQIKLNWTAEDETRYREFLAEEE